MGGVAAVTQDDQHENALPAQPSPPGTGASSSPPRISVVIPTRNRSTFLQETLAGLACGQQTDFEVLVMDQSDDDATERVVAGFDERVIYHRMPRRGANPARNLGAALARADLVAFVDDDCVPRPDWLSRIVEAFRTQPELEFIFGQLKAPPHDGAGGWFPETLPPPDIHTRRIRRKISAIGAGANMSCRKTFLRRVGGFDELLGPNDMSVINADTPMAYKAFRQANWLASSEIEVVHVNGFRPKRELAALYRSYARELGINYGRFTRRGDLSAAWIFLLEQWDILAPALAAVVRLRRPRRLGALLPYARGFVRGLLVVPRLGFVDGAAFRRMEAAGTLDAE